MIPVTHMLTTEDFIYRIRSAKASAVICTPMDEVPDKVKAAVEELNAACRLYS